MFALTETQALVEETARRFRSERLAPLASSIDREGSIPLPVLQELATLGLMGVNVSSGQGGSGAGVGAYALAMMQIARGCAATAVTMAVTNMVAEVIEMFGSQEQRDQRLPAILEGKGLGAFALSEADAGSDPSALQTRATPTGSTAKTGVPGYTLDGIKQWISHADTASTLVVWARTPKPQGRDGSAELTCFLVDGDAPGLSITRTEEKLGLNGSHTCTVSLDGVHVTEGDRLGAEGDGFRIAMMALDGGRIGIAAQSVGIAEAALEAAVAYAKERKTFGVPIGDHQAIQWMLADSRSELDAARLLTLRAAALKEQGQPFSREASMAKLYASEAAWRVCDRALQIHGGFGYTRDYPVERHLRDARVTRIYEGTSEIQRLVIARSILRMA